MRYQSLGKAPTIVISLLVGITILLLWGAIRSYNDALYIGAEYKQDEEISNTLDVIPISLDDPIIGAKGAPITVIAFADFLCDACRSQHNYLSEILARYPESVKIIWKDFSIATIPQSSELAHIYGYCVNKQGQFAAYQDAVYAGYLTVSTENLEEIVQTLDINQQALDNCLASGAAETHIAKTKILARALNLQAAPTFFVRGTQIQTPVSIDGWVQTLGLRP